MEDVTSYQIAEVAKSEKMREDERCFERKKRGIAAGRRGMKVCGSLKLTRQLPPKICRTISAESHTEVHLQQITIPIPLAITYIFYLTIACHSIQSIVWPEVSRSEVDPSKLRSEGMLALMAVLIGPAEIPENPPLTLVRYKEW
jgi:hypothetical protein